MTAESNKPMLDRDDGPPIRFSEISLAIEFCCWVVIALTPFLRWVNGAAVTEDQFIIQVAIVTLAVTGAIGLRVYNWRMLPKAKTPPDGDQSHRE